ncbi:receptor-type tyrosine-protein phosphatase zeta [Lasius niger]|uniref:protein-tyrosine-phosphatase n=1 Tax=Lasius niger TaxID=67767 RepID=A0A0J7NMM8_LASNI|nr:receptor-type tyrosine-protein phosphatase zeta [Lasius niger]
MATKLTTIAFRDIVSIRRWARAIAEKYEVANAVKLLELGFKHSFSLNITIANLSCNHFQFIMRKRQTRFNYGERCRPVSLDAYSLDSVSAYNSVRRKGAVRSSKRSYGNPTFEDSSAIPSHPLNFAGLSSFCNDVNAINEEFAGIPQVSGKIDELPPGAEVKNRYANVIPLPETRVQLQKLNNDASTEYINASYVRGPKNATKYYIACQAPIESTVTDFWRMIWEQQCKVIIMLTDLVENGVEKCTEYIPPSEVTDCHRLYGDFQVTLKKREAKEKYAISTLQLKVKIYS